MTVATNDLEYCLHCYFVNIEVDASSNSPNAVIVQLPDRGPTFLRSVLFFDSLVIRWVYKCFLAWLPERQPWGTLAICINPRWPLWTHDETSCFKSITQNNV